MIALLTPSCSLSDKARIIDAIESAAAELRNGKPKT